MMENSLCKAQKGITMRNKIFLSYDSKYEKAAHFDFLSFYFYFFTTNFGFREELLSYIYRLLEIAILFIYLIFYIPYCVIQFFLRNSL